MSRRQPDLQRQDRHFAVRLTELLNGTVTHGVRLRSCMDRHGRAVVGYKVTENNLVGECVPLTVSQAPASLYLSVLHTLELDNSGARLTTTKSSYTLQAESHTNSILTYDFVLEPPNEFPEAHVHIHGSSDALEGMLRASGRTRGKPADLRLPVGGRRFRPCLEDLIEFCILERLVTPREDWQRNLRRSRDEYRAQQLRAAVSRDPSTAAEALRRDGWQTVEPDS